MATSEHSAGIGCCGLLAALVVVGLVVQFWLQLLLLVLSLGLVALVAADVAKLARAAEERRRCPVCNSWSKSVVLSDLEPAGDPLCPAHAARARRICALEEQLLPDPFLGDAA